jgi:LEA14-like dessication related protein
VVTFTNRILCIAVMCLLGACASMQTAINAPQVSLRNVTVSSVDFSKQTFVLGFDVSNPNPFPLPINYVSYGLKLNEQQFASGETLAAFTVPANGDGEFAISVDLDLLRTAPQLLYTVRDGVTNGLSYELSGKLGVDIPFVEQLPFKSSGEVRATANAIQGRNRDN